MASKSKTSYSSKWEEQFSWLRKSTDADCAYCKLCNKSFRIDGGGISQVKSHQRARTHADKERHRDSSQRTFVTSGKSVNLSSGSLTLTHEESVVKAEILQALQYVEANYSFASAKKDTERFRTMFPDSEIARNYQQGETKIRYSIQYGIAPYVKDLLVTDFSGTPFSFKFDETTTSQVKKQYDAYVQYWSKRNDCITTSYCGSLFVGHCTNENLIEHFEHFGEDMQWNPSNLLHLGMDGPKVNLAFQEKLSKSLEDKHNTSFLDIGTCPLHTVHNAFAKGLKFLNFDVEQFIFDINGFFKLSSARREDFKSLEEVTELPAHFNIKHSSTRWVTLKKVAVRMLEQWKNLEEYFLVFLPKQPNFKGKNGIKENKRYQQIKKALENDLTKLYLSFIAYASQDFESFLFLFQSDEPLIHMLYQKMGDLLLNLMVKFCRNANLHEDSGSPKSIHDLAQLDVTLQKVQKPAKTIDVGTKAKLFLTESSLSDEERIAFRGECLKFYAASVTYLQEKLPINVSLIRNAQYLHPEKRNDGKAMSAVSNLCLKMGTCLKNVIRNVFSLGNNESVEELCDKVRDQWRKYQCEEIPPEFFQKPECETNSQSNPKTTQSSYWKAAFESFGLEIPEVTQTKLKRIDEYWKSVGKMVDDLGQLKYPQLFALVKCVLSLSHGNSSPERGFSINKYLLSVHGSSTSNDTIIALRHVKDHLVNVGGYMKFSISRNLILSVKSARQKYQQDLEAKRLLQGKEAQRLRLEKERREEDRVVKEKLSKVEAEIKIKQSGITIAEEAVQEGNEKLQTQLKASKFSRTEIQRAQSMIDMGLTRKRSLTIELEELEKIKVKLSKKQA